MKNKINTFINKLFHIINSNTQTSLPINDLPTTISTNPPTTSPIDIPLTTSQANSPVNNLPNNAPDPDLRASTSTALPTDILTDLLMNLSTTLPTAISTAISTSLSTGTVICKPGNEWTQDDLDYYKIKTKFVDEKDFFGQSVDKVTLDDIPDNFFLYESFHEIARDNDLQQKVNKENKYLIEFMFLMGKSLGGTEVEESGLADFAAYLLYMFDYNTWKRVICTRQRLDLIMGLKTTYVMSDVCIMDVNYCSLFLIQEDKWYMRDTCPKAEIIAGAIAAFQHNNSRRKYLLKKPLDTYTFPCLTIRSGRRFTFYKITVNQSLCDAVEYGICPETTSTMQIYSPTESMSSDIFNSSCRKKVMQCLKLFKDHIKDFDTDQSLLSLPSSSY